MIMTEISPNGKLLASIALTPLVADFLQDACEAGLLSTEMNQNHIKNLVYKIRKLDREVMDNADQNAQEQQIDIQRAFRQWLNINFSEEENNK